MKLYTVTKQVRAKPMNWQDYNALRGWDVPADENPADEGYLVENVDGGKPNHPDFQGYISWSPKNVFERAYKIGPLTSGQMIEAQASKAPRTTPEDIEANIVREHYFTARQGVDGKDIDRLRAENPDMLLVMSRNLRDNAFEATQALATFISEDGGEFDRMTPLMKNSFNAELGALTALLHVYEVRCGVLSAPETTEE